MLVSGRGAMPYPVALARAAEQIPQPGALPGGSRYEPKWDGFRALASNGFDGPQIWSRRGTDLTDVFPELTKAIAEQVESGTVVDGEIVVWRAGHLAFDALLERMGRGPRTAAAAARSQPASFALFDVLADQGEDVRGRPYDDRRALLEARAAAWSPPLNLSPVTDDLIEATTWFETYIVVGVEGLVVKGGSQPYRGDVRDWVKVKHRASIDVVCAAVTGTLAQPYEIVAGLMLDDRLRIVGRSTPLSAGARRTLSPLLREPMGEHPWPRRVSPGTFARIGGRKEPISLTLVKPIVVEVSADVAWSGRAFRHPLRFVRARPDAEVGDVRPPGD